ncbi:hypothetical protein [Actinoplanes teichomyceticus]|uniref:Uncharacterized protein n=1 Tax=Actinoplanes teichomyceticus TaxID=1867 RepID=A0A561WSA0_ACTTI|nr:hypothetical protein [Actinoplanes teichomyceticus]TWG26732.1 hypothetical protein FHX34_1011729 [Actinoplanes teichomyceticus]GIF15131.1 hypothetical protein Ate01nite_51630 [Actinoplanes teichomyceticus]
MDPLDRLMAAAGPLLSRVDQVLSTAGAPQGHRVWPELRRVRLLPGDAARAVAALRPAAVAEAAPQLRAQARACADTADALPVATSWTGDAAEAYEAARRRAAEQLNAGPDSLSRRMTATADLADALTDWMTSSRHELAGALAEALTSAEAMALATGGGFPDSGEARAAADVAALLLRTVGDSYDRAEHLLADAAPLRSPQPV